MNGYRRDYALAGLEAEEVKPGYIYKSRDWDKLARIIRRLRNEAMALGEDDEKRETNQDMLLQ